MDGRAAKRPKKNVFVFLKQKSPHSSNIVVYISRNYQKISEEVNLRVGFMEGLNKFMHRKAIEHKITMVPFMIYDGNEVAGKKAVYEELLRITSSFERLGGANTPSEMVHAHMLKEMEDYREDEPEYDIDSELKKKHKEMEHKRTISQNKHNSAFKAGRDKAKMTRRNRRDEGDDTAFLDRVRAANEAPSKIQHYETEEDGDRILEREKMEAAIEFGGDRFRESASRKPRRR